MLDVIDGMIPDIVLRSPISRQNRIYIEVKDTEPLGYGIEDSKIARYFLHLLATTTRGPKEGNDIRRAVLLCARLHVPGEGQCGDLESFPNLLLWPRCGIRHNARRTARPMAFVLHPAGDAPPDSHSARRWRQSQEQDRRIRIRFIVCPPAVIVAWMPREPQDQTRGRRSDTFSLPKTISAQSGHFFCAAGNRPATAAGSRRDIHKDLRCGL